MAGRSFHCGKVYCMAAGIYYRIPLAAVSCAYSGHTSEDLEPKWFSSFRALVPRSIRPRTAQRESLNQALEKVPRPPNGDTQ